MDGAQILNCVRSEIHNVLSTMRRNGRWASEERFMREIPSDFENPMIRSLRTLHDYLQPFEDISDVDAVAYLQPFLDVVAFPNTNGAMTGRALSSVNKFLLYGAVTKESPRGREAINLAVASVVECKFEATNSYSDEVVLMQLLEVLVNLLRCQAGSYISDINVWRMVETCFRLKTESGTSQLLRSTAANSLTHLILTLFSRSSELITVDAVSEMERRMQNFSGSRDDYLEAIMTQGRSRRRSEAGEDILDEDDVATDDDDNDEGEDGPDSGGATSELNEDGQSASEAWDGSSTSEGGKVTVMPTSATGDFEDSGERQAQLSGQLSPIVSTARNLTYSEGLQATHQARGVQGHQRQGHGQNQDPDEVLYRMLQPIRFGNSSSAARSQALQGGADSYGLPVLVKVLDFMAQLTDPSFNSESARVFALQLINIVLESGGDNLAVSAPPMESSPIISLEVFLTSVHLRIAESPSATYERKELALESLLDFCREPALMLDLYTNYDCDFRCTNLFETLCKCLCRCSIPLHVLANNARIASITGLDTDEDMGPENAVLSAEDFASSLDLIMELSEDLDPDDDSTGITVLEGVALEGVLAVIDSIARRCVDSPPQESIAAAVAQATARERQASPVDWSAFSETNGGEEDLQWLANARQRRAEMLRERKQMKRRLLLAARQFNKKPNKMYWLEYAQDLNVLPTPVTPKDIADFFLKTPGLDKAAVGEYLSEDPAYKPFNHEVMQAYLASFDFAGVRIDRALRMFLASFRLPGEAQRVDRVVEAFGKQLYAQNTTPAPEGHEDADEDARCIFRSADAAYIFAFSIIMLHTDLHNQGITAEKKMKLHEFVRNNRNINAGENLPETLLTSVYEAIRDEEMRMLYDPHAHSSALQLEQTDAATPSRNSLTGVGTTWDTVLRHSQVVDKALFTPRALGRLGVLRAGVHERDMYTILFDSSMQAISVMFEMTRDGKMAARALEGFRNLGKIAVYFRLFEHFNRIMITLCKYFVRFFPALQEGAQTQLDLEGLEALRDATVYSTQGKSKRQKLAASLAKGERFAAYPACRALLTFRALLSLTKQYGSLMRESWRNFVQTLLVMHELDMLPSSFVEVDDVVDQHGNRLPTSAALLAQSDPLNTTEGNRLQHQQQLQQEDRSSQHQRQQQQQQQGGRPRGHRALSVETDAKRAGGAGARGGVGAAEEEVKEAPKRGGFFSALTSLIWSEDDGIDEHFLECRELVRETLTACRLNTVFSKSKSLSQPSLLLLIDALLVPLEDATLSAEAAVAAGVEDIDDGTSFEQNNILCVELLTEVGLANKESIETFWPLLHRAFRQVLVNAGALPEGDDEAAAAWDTPAPLRPRPARVVRAGKCSLFVVERVVVNLLRISVQVLDKPQTMSHLLSALSWLGDFSDELCVPLAARIGSGLSTVLRFHAGNVSAAQDWRIVCRLLDRFAHFRDSVDATWHIVCTLVRSGHVSRINMNAIVDTIRLFIRDDERAALPGVDPDALAPGDRAAEAVGLIYEISRQVYSRDPDFCASIDSLAQVEAAAGSGAASAGLNAASDGLEQQPSAETENGHIVAAKAKDAGDSGEEGLEMDDFVTSPMHRMLNGSYVVEGPDASLLPDRDKCWMLLVLQLRYWFADPRPEVAAAATQSLQSALWSPPERIEQRRWPEIFNKILFPLVEDTARQDATFAPQKSIRAINLLMRTFLHNVGVLGQTSDFGALWLRTVTITSKLLAKGGTVRESTLENLRNLMMVMQAENLFQKVSEKSGENTWEVTWSVLEAEAPGVRELIEESLSAMAPPAQQPPAVQPTSAAFAVAQVAESEERTNEDALHEATGAAALNEEAAHNNVIEDVQGALEESQGSRHHKQGQDVLQGGENEDIRMYTDSFEMQFLL
ncbi:Brefeldin A-inhibited guanine nucleotide-exchange protein 1 [Hondaea fermentalgiana]|uniref:Brefeldin A-inhibited guanine nucleotide-exchange protein 1 n=1 Tax=Hondaea fermentalgiana TaxID=2315210 RepID=A0A2R5FZ46_9STRA|nr:Brefeldin A-inhibited guanine nucleotide-exchange protein 1 [Hondaea fermentalgiana]|eukprot:GBG24000.1 Brefeldin A-inhibited guanine nucleotide-exchange protein 1 [Hondaea fermentalgiana]